jgi:hypothetical protein
VALDRWTYDIRIVDGSTVTGHGTLDSSGIRTRKELRTAAGALTLRFDERLDPVDAERCEREHLRLLGRRAPPVAPDARTR